MSLPDRVSALRQAVVTSTKTIHEAVTAGYTARNEVLPEWTHDAVREVVLTAQLAFQILWGMFDSKKLSAASELGVIRSATGMAISKLQMERVSKRLIPRWAALTASMTKP